MPSEFPAGLSRSDIEFILKHDNDVLSVERIDGATALWNVSVSVDGQPPIKLLVDNGINEIYVQVLLAIDAEHIVEALQAVQPYAVVGLTSVADGLFMRSGFFIEHSTMHALTNSYRAVALASAAYQEAIAG